MAEPIASLVSDTEAGLVRPRYVVIYSPGGKGRKRFPGNCVVEHASEDERRAEARRDQRESDERAQRAFVASAHARPAGALRRAQSEES